MKFPKHPTKAQYLHTDPRCCPCSPFVPGSPPPSAVAGGRLAGGCWNSNNARAVLAASLSSHASLSTYQLRLDSCFDCEQKELNGGGVAGGRRVWGFICAEASRHVWTALQPVGLRARPVIPRLTSALTSFVPQCPTAQNDLLSEKCLPGDSDAP